MKNFSMNTTSKYILTTALTVALTVAWVNAWAGLTASNGDKLDYAKWNQLVNTVQSGIPTGAVMSFNLPSCPAGWSAYTTAAGRTIIGAGNGAGLKSRAFWETGGGEAAVSYKIMVTPGSAWTLPVNGTFNYWITWSKVWSNNIWGFTTTAPSMGNEAGLTWIVPVDDQTGLSSSTDNMQPYVALLYCVKN